MKLEQQVMAASAEYLEQNAKRLSVDFHSTAASVKLKTQADN